jgi:hypothetical protein
MFSAAVSKNDGNRNLFVKFRNDATDSITVFNDLTSNAWGVSSGITQLQFSDGSSVNLGQPVAGQGAPLTFTWLGSNNNYFLGGSTLGSNVYEITQGSGSINFANNAAVGGTNTVKYGRGSGNASVSLNGGTGTIAFDSSVSAQDVYWQSGNNGSLLFKIMNDTTDSITVFNDLTNNAWGVSSGINKVLFSDGSSVNLGHQHPAKARH